MIEQHITALQRCELRTYGLFSFTLILLSLTIAQHSPVAIIPWKLITVVCLILLTAVAIQAAKHWAKIRKLPELQRRSYLEDNPRTATQKKIRKLIATESVWESPDFIHELDQLNYQAYEEQLGRDRQIFLRHRAERALVTTTTMTATAVIFTPIFLLMVSNV